MSRHRYRLVFISERRRRKVFSLSLPLWVVILLTGLLAMLTALLAVIIVVRTPLRRYLPGYLDMSQRGELVELAMRVDSLDRQSQLRSAYLQTLTDVLRDRSATTDDVPTYDSAVVHFDDVLRESSEREQAFVARYEQQTRFALTDVGSLDAPTLFLAPARGDSLTADGRLYVSAATVAIAPFDGTVLAVDYLLGEGYKLTLQHVGDYVVVLSHLTRPMVAAGSVVKAGAVVAHAGESPSHADRWMGVAVWHKGQRIDPQNVMQL